MERGVSERFGAAKRIIRAAGQIALEYFAHYDDLEVETKTSRQDTVSVADNEVETFIRTEIAKLALLDGPRGSHPEPLQLAARLTGGQSASCHIACRG